MAVTASFTYNGTSSVCTSAAASAEAYNSIWKITNTYATKSGNSGTATTSATEYNMSVPLHTYKKSVSLSCDKNGTLS